MNKPSLKKTMIYNLCDIIVSGVSSPITFITASGIIMGDPVFEGYDTSNDGTNVMKKLTKTTSDNYCKEYDVDLPIEGSDGYILLENVTIFSHTKSHLSHLILFYDQIIGVTFGSVNSN